MSAARFWVAGLYLVFAGVPTALAYVRSWVWWIAFTAAALVVPISVLLVMTWRTERRSGFRL
jgi:hypothetical protein